jgi:hypothetical protein
MSSVMTPFIPVGIPVYWLLYPRMLFAVRRSDVLLRCLSLRSYKASVWSRRRWAYGSIHGPHRRYRFLCFQTYVQALSLCVLVSDSVQVSPTISHCRCLLICVLVLVPDQPLLVEHFLAVQGNSNSFVPCSGGLSAVLPLNWLNRSSRCLSCVTSGTAIELVEQSLLFIILSNANHVNDQNRTLHFLDGTWHLCHLQTSR